MFLRCLSFVAMSLFAPIAPAIAGPLDDEATHSKVTPATFVTDLGSADRIQAADRLRTLSQETSAATCFLQHGIQPDHNHAVLTSNLSEFDQILDALLWGDPERNIIGQESHPQTMHKLYDMAGEWHNLRSVVAEFVADPYDKDAAASVLAQSEPMLTKTNVGPKDRTRSLYVVVERIKHGAEGSV